MWVKMAAPRADYSTLVSELSDEFEEKGADTVYQ
jgi:hypothetical protein